MEHPDFEQPTLSEFGVCNQTVVIVRLRLIHIKKIKYRNHKNLIEAEDIWQEYTENYT